MSSPVYSFRMRPWNLIPRFSGTSLRHHVPFSLSTQKTAHQHSTRYAPRCAGSAGFTLLEVCAVSSCVLLLLVVGLSRLWDAKRNSGRNPLLCQQNLKQIGAALFEFTADHGDRYPWEVPGAEGGSRESLAGGQAAPHFRSLTNNIRNARVFLCPMDPVRHRGGTLATLDDSSISYFINSSATAGRKNQILAGDRTLSPTDDTTTGELEVYGQSKLYWSLPVPDEAGHTIVDTGERTGNLLFNSGSLMETTTPQLQRIIRSLGTSTNRFILP